MNSNGLNEKALITKLSRQFSLAPASSHLGIGDDCAVLPSITRGQKIVISTDSLVEGVHFRRDWSSPEDLAVKSLESNISDVAAMGARPRAVLLAWSLPRNIGNNWVDRFLRQFKKELRQRRVELIGGNTTASPAGIVITITVLGIVPERQIKLRSGAKVGDILCVTSFLGDSAAGLRLLKSGAKAPKSLVRKHLRPQAHVEEGCFLGTFSAVHAMMDLSDGLKEDLPRMLEASNKGARVELERIPTSKDLQITCAKKKWSASELAVVGGEDYSLLLAVHPLSFKKISTAFKKKFRRPLFAIGKVSKGKKLLYVEADIPVDIPVDIKLKSFRHF